MRGMRATASHAPRSVKQCVRETMRPRGTGRIGHRYETPPQGHVAPDGGRPYPGDDFVRDRAVAITPGHPQVRSIRALNLLRVLPST